MCFPVVILVDAEPAPVHFRAHGVAVGGQDGDQDAAVGGVDFAAMGIVAPPVSTTKALEPGTLTATG